MKVRRLEMKSFRGFSELALDFHGQVTVLVGVNGAGKTSILDCLALLLGQIPPELLKESGKRPQLTEADIALAKPYTLNSLEVTFHGETFRWSLAHMRRGFPQQASSDLSGVKALVSETESRILEGQQLWVPLAMYYPVNRIPATDVPLQHEPNRGGLDIELSSFLDAYTEALGGTRRDFKRFFEWFREREDLENEERLQVNPSHRDRQLEAVRAAIERLVPGFSGLRVQRAHGTMVVQKDGTTLELGQLSDGEKGLLALAGDLARRLAIANPRLQEPLSAEAVVLIDEIELHLHPGWQRLVVEQLGQTFPNCQFILTTHSPQVLSQIPAESVVLLDRFQRVSLPAGTLGRDSNSILSEVMGIPERPEASASRIHDISGMIDSGELPRAREALDELAKQLGEQDSEVVRLRALIGFLGG
ncbi:AAA family ATPase [Hyalangium gracile]|uniref:AAA family ATPase n=1 Tax=Hyalangium gracile TaxID=394092 RepID=UPI001CCC0E0B|nr:AAA family ATPase [Hyalangium gracile]